GHGHWDEGLKQGFWLPKNAERLKRAEWLPNGSLRDYIGGIPARHTILISDSCFSGSIFKSREAFAQPTAEMKELYQLPSRQAMTSGALQSVPDKSVFVEYLVKRLEQNQEPYMSAESLFSSLRKAVINNSPNGQVPQFGEIREAGDEGGDFIFVKRTR
ncbi:MAG TPA: peptidase C14, partial [Acidobacteriota bacterium]|nr:peptidase C14 [Acidobacteriota bacterium]